MDFEYTCSIWIEEDDLDFMARKVVEGEDFQDVFENVMCGYDDADYYNSDYIFNDVEIEVRKRVSRMKGNQAPKISKEAEEVLNNYLKEVVTNSYRCSHCGLKHGDNTCFFAYECIKSDFSKWRD